MGIVYLKTPLTEKDVSNLRAGDQVYITGVIYTARDAAHKRLVDLIEKGEELPFNIENQLIFFMGPSPAKPGRTIGSAGPTTSYRMDKYSPILLEHGLRGMIGKGERNQEVKESMIKNKAIYLVAVGGAGALIAKTIEKSEVIAYNDLEAEAIMKLTIKNFSAIVANDLLGNDLYLVEKGKYAIK